MCTKGLDQIVLDNMWLNVVKVIVMFFVDSELFFVGVAKWVVLYGFMVLPFEITVQF